MVVEEQLRGRLGVLAKLNPARPKESLLIPIAYRDFVPTQGFLRQFQILLYTQAVKRVGTRDCRIAASAINRGFTVVTANLRHFQQIPGVQAIDWSA